MGTPQSPKRVLVTGASRGIGRAIALAFLKDGWEVALCARDAAKLASVAQHAGLSGGQARCVSVDLANRAACDAALASLLADWGRLDGVVLGHAVNRATPLSGAEGEFERMIEQDLVSPMRMMRTLVPALNDGARVVLIGSVLGRFGVPAQHGYCASKAGLAGFARALALDLAPRGITVNCLQPGWVDTDMARQSIDSQSRQLGMTPEEMQSFFAQQLPMKRFLVPEEIAAHVRWLFSTGAAAVTGQAPNHDSGAMA